MFVESKDELRLNKIITRLNVLITTANILTGKMPYIPTLVFITIVLFVFIAFELQYIMAYIKRCHKKNRYTIDPTVVFNILSVLLLILVISTKINNIIYK